MKFPLLKKTVAMYSKEDEIPPSLRDAHAKVKNADAYVVVSAEYNHSIPPALSNLMDYFPIPSFKYKPCSIITYSMGEYYLSRDSVERPESQTKYLMEITLHFRSLWWSEGGHAIKSVFG